MRGHARPVTLNRHAPQAATPGGGRPRADRRDGQGAYHGRGGGDHFASSSGALLHVPATGTPAVSLSSATLSHGHIRISLGCPKSEAYCRFTVTVTVPAGTLATGSIRVAGGGRATLALVPKQATLKRLRAGRYPITVNVLAVDQSGHRKRIRFSGYCVTGAHFKLVTLHVR